MVQFKATLPISVNHTLIKSNSSNLALMMVSTKRIMKVLTNLQITSFKIILMAYSTAMEMLQLINLSILSGKASYSIRGRPIESL